MTKLHHKHPEQGQANSRSILWWPHKDWRAWVGLALMLTAIVIYVLTLDDSNVAR